MGRVGATHSGPICHITVCPVVIVFINWSVALVTSADNTLTHNDMYAGGVSFGDPFRFTGTCIMNMGIYDGRYHDQRTDYFGARE